METNIDENHIYKNALKRIVELDRKLQDSFISAGYYIGGETSKYFSEAIQIARNAISEGAIANVRKQ